MTIKPSIALRALSIFLAFSATFLPFIKTTNAFAEEEPTCKDGYEYVAAVGKCYKACTAEQERNPETLRCRKISVTKDTTETTATETTETKTTGETAATTKTDTTKTETTKTEETTKAATTETPKTTTKETTSKADYADESIPTCKEGYEYVEAADKCYKACTAEQERNPETLRCRKITTTSTSEKATTSKSTSEAAYADESIPTCKEGYEYVESAGKCYKACSEGQIRNPETNRCKKAASASSSTSASSSSSSAKNSETTCKEGYEYVESAGKCYKACSEGQERNPETNRCKKVTNNDGADYDVEVPNTGGGTSFVAVGAIIAIVLAGIAFAAYQYRKELKAFYKKHFKKV